MYQFYSEGFWGYGENGDFQYYTIEHFLPLLLLLVAILLVYRYRNSIREWKWEGRFRFIFAFVMITIEMSYFWRLLYVGSGSPDTFTLMTKLPLQVCQWTCIAAVFLITSKNPALFQICYFLCIPFDLIALSTPAVITTTGPSYYRYYQFFGEHMLPLFTVFYMLFVHKMRPDWKKMWIPLGGLILLSIPCVYANMHIDGANYMYMVEETVGDSPANFFPPVLWIRYVSYLVISIVMFWIVYLPYALVARRAGKDKK